MMGSMGILSVLTSMEVCLINAVVSQRARPNIVVFSNICLMTGWSHLWPDPLTVNKTGALRCEGPPLSSNTGQNLLNGNGRWYGFST